MPTNKKTVSIIGTVGLPACYGGFESLVQNLVDYQSNNISYVIYCSSKHYKKKQSVYKNAKLKYINLNANGIASIFYDGLSLFSCSIKRNDVTLILGVSGCIFLPFFKLISKSKIITNIDGLEWKRDKWGKLTRRFLKFSEKLAVKYSDVIIADNQAIADYINNEYTIISKVIAYGGDHAITKFENLSDNKDNFFLSICRIEPENNIHIILESFSKLQSQLKFVGNWSSSEYGIKLKEKFKHYSNLELLDPIYDINVLFTLRNKCKGYIHGHSAGGTNPSLVEAMHFGMPIFAFDCTFNRYSTENKAIYFHNTESLIDKILKFERENGTTEGKLLRKIAIERYSWKNIVNMYENLY
ncbi:DUF1972 domain-containing protein [Escherichia coli]|uniref:DUF1972 domain-containing protein n=1 Tax=Escherichia coli TaxID=562 RepID=UPI001865F59C|nr:DUF1972 domain-containing protein [Escherichia coli]HCJ9453892.1 DUF1972 domain-containing protein [Escherichia coli]